MNLCKCQNIFVLKSADTFIIDILWEYNSSADTFIINIFCGNITLQAYTLMLTIEDGYASGNFAIRIFKWYLRTLTVGNIIKSCQKPSIVAIVR